jgi:hypothetical protein
MRERLRGMELVARKGESRKAVMKRKPGMALMIAIGAPKKPPMGDEMDEQMGGKDEKMSKADKIAALQEKIARLKAELALLEDEDEMEEVEEDAYEEDEERDEEMD